MPRQWIQLCGNWKRRSKEGRQSISGGKSETNLPKKQPKAKDFCPPHSQFPDSNPERPPGVPMSLPLPTQEGLHRTKLICPSAATQAIPLARAFAFVGLRFRLGVSDLGLSTYFATEKSNPMRRRGLLRIRNSVRGSRI